MSLEACFEGTVNKVVTFEGPKFIGKGNSVVRVHPAESGGIRFRTEYGESPADSDHVTGHRMGFSHILVAAHRPVVKPKWGDISVFVPEHFLSAMSLAGINHAVAEVDGRVVRKEDSIPLAARFIFARDGWLPRDWKATSLPIMDGTAAAFYSELKTHRRDLSRKMPVYQVTRSFYASSRGGNIFAEYGDDFSVKVKAMPGDKFRLNPATFEIRDVYLGAEENVSARALLRLPRWKDHVPRKIIESTEDFFAGSIGGSYLVIDPNESVRAKTVKMDARYQKGRNEPFVHAALSDIPGEMYVFWPGQIRGRFVFGNVGGGHTGRMELFRKMYNEGVLEKIG